MKRRLGRDRAEHVLKMPLLTVKDAAEYDRIRKNLVEALQKMGGYVPAWDDLFINDIARATVYSNKIEMYIDSEDATVDTYYKVTETKYKFSMMIERAIHQLAVARRDRIGKQTESSLMNELREALLRGLKATAEPEQ